MRNVRFRMIASSWRRWYSSAIFRAAARWSNASIDRVAGTMTPMRSNPIARTTRTSMRDMPRRAMSLGLGPLDVGVVAGAAFRAVRSVGDELVGLPAGTRGEVHDLVAPRIERRPTFVGEQLSKALARRRRLLLAQHVDLDALADLAHRDHGRLDPGVAERCHDADRD